MSSHQQKIRVVPASSVRDIRRLMPVARAKGLTALRWNFVGRTDDDLSLAFIVDLSRQRVSSVAGAQVTEDGDSVTVAILGFCATSDSDRVASARYGEYMVNLVSPLAGRAVLNPAT
ncbi:MAG: hypothetical protein JWQ81_2677 [Amycolatopsis sp.]|uniref:hypothetical protein n=1 Tax=Amycolatopsis sp. TaxID=37632 RepID=UPI0026138D5A|nr:hypothetical protein [Amycolatopsis sp.]MCU1681938.1 hypothetical protein [Amycolatopsis sp.]